MHDFGNLIKGPDELPSDALGVAEVLGLNPNAAYAELASAWARIDLARRSEVGAAGESLLLQALEQSCRAQVVHMSQISDGYGYDIAVVGDDLETHLEVKSTTRRGRTEFYLSRNEYQTMLRDSSWELVFCVLSHDLSAIELVYSVDKDWIERAAPVDLVARGHWQSARFDAEADALAPWQSCLDC
ncbi:DUF3883 domain-containing protein [Herbiconiux aconitum]|uniref:DUF3883 domain-containing protein n=1 Tax=Herbiconiux aconitum TaxID=2970913 RepID=UPI003556A381